MTRLIGDDLDNIDHNPSSATSTGTFHGTSLSLFQNITTDSNTTDDDDRGFTHSITHLKAQRKVMDLPISYSEIRPTCLPSSDVYVPITASNLTSTCETLNAHLKKLRRSPYSEAFLIVTPPILNEEQKYLLPN